jgi:uncharacterized short protein YbdD (DUF466 family)
MKTIFNGKLVPGRLQTTTATRESGALGTQVSELARALRGACMQMFGIPDYERYLGHMAARHPCDSPLSRHEFFIRSIDRKYAGNGPRCC